MDRAEKRKLVSTLNEAWTKIGVIVVAHYKGMTVAQMTDYRKRVKSAGGQVKVAKNRLAKLALKDTVSAGVSDLLRGQTCFAYSEDPVVAARISVRYARENDRLVIIGGSMGKTLLDPGTPLNPIIQVATSPVPSLRACCRRRVRPTAPSRRHPQLGAEAAPRKENEHVDRKDVYTWLILRKSSKISPS